MTFIENKQVETPMLSSCQSLNCSDMDLGLGFFVAGVDDAIWDPFRFESSRGLVEKLATVNADTNPLAVRGRSTGKVKEEDGLPAPGRENVKDAAGPAPVCFAEKVTPFELVVAEDHSPYRFLLIVFV